MKFVTTLCELGVAMPEVLDATLGYTVEATALESVRHAACTNAREALDGPPPAMLHPSRLPGASALYGSQCAPPFDESAYCDVSMESMAALQPGKVVGACTMDVCKGHSRPVVLYSKSTDSGTQIRIEVYGAPLAAMEVELFAQTRFASAFEQRWLGPDDAAHAKDMRAQLGRWIRRRGYERTAARMHGKLLCLVRPGVLPLLRLRQPANAREADEVRALLERTAQPSEGTGSLKELLDTAPLADTVTVQTIFYQAPAAEKPEPLHDCAAVASHSVLSSLAILTLKHLKNEDYYGVEAPEDELLDDDADAAEADEPDLDGFDGESASVASAARQKKEEALRSVEEKEATAISENMTREVEHASLAATGSRVLMHLTGATQRVCDIKLLVRSSSMEQVATSLVNAFLCASDARTLRRLLDGPEAQAKASCTSLVAFLARCGLPKHAILLLSKESDGTLSSSRLFARDGDWEVPFDSVTRYLMFPWVLVIVHDDDMLHRINVYGVQREELALSAATREAAAALAAAAPVQPAALPTEVVQFISEARQGLGALSGLQARLDSIEQTLQAPRAPPPVAASVVASAAPVATPPESDITRGFKRIYAHLEAYNEQTR